MGPSDMVARIERIIVGVVMNRVEPDENGSFHCLPQGQNMAPLLKTSLDEVADWLRTNPKGGVRMNPTWTKLSRNIFIDGLPR